jgi:hypothetical protein
MIKIGSKWKTVDKKFIVIDVIEKQEELTNRFFSKTSSHTNNWVKITFFM